MLYMYSYLKLNNTSFRPLFYLALFGKITGMGPLEYRGKYNREGAA
jgi:hypothetical protein